MDFNSQLRDVQSEFADDPVAGIERAQELGNELSNDFCVQNFHVDFLKLHMQGKVYYSGGNCCIDYPSYTKPREQIVEMTYCVDAHE